VAKLSLPSLPLSDQSRFAMLFKEVILCIKVVEIGWWIKQFINLQDGKQDTYLKTRIYLLLNDIAYYILLNRGS